MRRFGLKHGGTIYMSDHRSRLETLADEVGATTIAGEKCAIPPGDCVSLANPEIVEILEGDGMKVVDVDEADTPPTETPIRDQIERELEESADGWKDYDEIRIRVEMRGPVLEELVDNYEISRERHIAAICESLRIELTTKTGREVRVTDVSTG